MLVIRLTALMLVAASVFAASHLQEDAVSDGQDAAPEVTSGPGRIEGALVTGDSQKVSRARVQVRLKRGQMIQEVVADEEGRFILEGLPVRPTEMTLRVSAPGIVPIEHDFVLPRRQPVIRDVVLSLPRGRDLTGRVVDSDGQGLEGVTTWLSWNFWTRHLRGASWRPTVTGADGRFSFQGAPRDNVTVWAWKPCHGMQSRELEKGQTELELRLSDRDPSYLEVTAHDVSGEPLPGVAVIVRPAEAAHRPAGFGGRVLTDAHGAVTFGPMPSIELTWEAVDGNRVFRSEKWSNVFGKGRLWLTPGRGNRLALQQVEYKRLNGRLRSRDGTVLKDVEVTAHVSGQREALETLTDEHGAFRFELPPDQRDRHRAYFRLLEGSHDFEKGQQGPHEWNEEVLELRAEARALVSGRVVGHGGRGVGAEVRCVWDSSGSHEPDRPSTRADPGGKFEILVPTVLERGVFLLAESGRTHRAQSPAIFPKPGEHLEGVVLTLEKDAELFGQVRDEHGAPVPEVTVRVVAEDGIRHMSVDADSRGSYRLTLPWEGRVTVAALQDDVWHDADQPTVLAANRTVGPVDIVVREPWVLQGTVETREGAPIENAVVSLRRSKDDVLALRSETTNSLGQFQFALPGGRPVEVTVVPPKWRDGDRLLGAVPSTVERTVESGAGAQRFTLETAGVGGFRGRIALPDGFGNNGLVFHLVAPGRERPSVARTEIEEGSFEITRVWAGDYELRVTSPCFSAIVKSIRVLPDRVIDIGELVLEPGALSSIRIIGTDQRPIEDVGVFFLNAPDLRTDASGNIELPLTGREPFEIRLFKEGYPFVETELAIDASGRQTSLVLPRAGTLRLRCRSIEVRKPAVEWLHGELRPLRLHTLDLDGPDHLLRDLPPGTYRVRIWDRSTNREWPGVSPGNAIEKVVELKEGEELLVDLTQ